MDKHVEERLRALDAEYEKGQQVLAELDTKRTNLVQILLRIDGARQVLRELLAVQSTDAEKP